MQRRLPSRAGLLLIGILVVHTTLVTRGSFLNAPNWDEIGHLPAGISYWQFGRFDLFNVNPPLVRLVAAIPVVLAKPKTDWQRYPATPDHRTEFQIGRRFIEINGSDAFWYFTLARWACLPFTWLAAYVSFRWAKELYGVRAGCLAACLWCFDPNVLAYAQLITPDVGATALGLAANYAFWKWLNKPSWKSAVWAAVLLGLTQLTKTTWIILFGLWPCLWFGWRWMRRPGVNATSPPPMQLVAILVIALYLLNLGYGFEGSFQRLGDFRFESKTLSHDGTGRPRFTVSNSFLAAIPVPAPKNYVYGIDRTKYEFESKAWSYLRGEWRYGGWWYYYLYAMAVKMPLGTACLLLLALGLTVLGSGYSDNWRDATLLLAPGIVILALVSSQTGFNHHLRYVLPAFPYLFVWASKVVRDRADRCRACSLLIAASLSFSICSSLWVWPHNLSYFQELVGGPLAGHAHLGGSWVDSNIDCGQDLLNLKRWLDKHPEATTDLKAALNGPLATTAIGIATQPPPEGWDSESESRPPPEQLGPQPGWYAVSVNCIRSRDRKYLYFLDFEPVATVGYSIYIYKITPDQARRVREAFGLPLLDQPVDDRLQSAVPFP